MRYSLPRGGEISLFDVELIEPKSTEDRARRRVAVVALKEDGGGLRRWEGGEVEI
jgi:hypothetical protein